MLIDRHLLKGGINLNQHMNSLGFKFDNIYRILTPVNDRFPACASDLQIKKCFRVPKHSPKFSLTRIEKL